MFRSCYKCLKDNEAGTKLRKLKDIWALRQYTKQSTSGVFKQLKTLLMEYR